MKTKEELILDICLRNSPGFKFEEEILGLFELNKINILIGKVKSFLYISLGIIFVAQAADLTYENYNINGIEISIVNICLVILWVCFVTCMFYLLHKYEKLKEKISNSINSKI
jgi:hypothetical protein